MKNINNNTHSHYSKIGKKYDSFEFYSNINYLNWFSDKIINYLNITKNDILCDIGCGTALIDKVIHKKINFTKKIICVDPSEAMLSNIEKNSDIIIPINMTANQFVNSSQANDVNVFLMNFVIHHIHNLQSFINKITLLLTSGKRMLITIRHTMKGFPLFEKLSNEYDKGANTTLTDLKLIFINNNLDVNINIEQRNYTIESTHFFHMLRNRFISTLYDFNDDEIELGIQEIKKKYGNVKLFNISDEVLFITIKSIRDTTGGGRMVSV